VGEGAEHPAAAEALSKKKQKKLRKQAVHDARKAAKKAAEKEAKRLHQEAKLSQVQEKIANMGEEERKAWYERRLQKRQVRAAALSPVPGSCAACTSCPGIAISLKRHAHMDFRL
jgi:hypothetical protein